MTPHQSPPVTIYAIRHPETDAVFYVGQTVRDARRRFREHLLESAQKRDPKSVWLQSLLVAGKVPRLEIIEQCPLERADAREQHWIRHYYARNPALLNRAGVDDAVPERERAARVAMPARRAAPAAAYGDGPLGEPSVVEWTVRVPRGRGGVATLSRERGQSGGYLSRLGDKALWAVGAIIALLFLLSQAGCVIVPVPVAVGGPSAEPAKTSDALGLHYTITLPAELSLIEWTAYANPNGNIAFSGEVALAAGTEPIRGVPCAVRFYRAGKLVSVEELLNVGFRLESGGKSRFQQNILLRPDQVDSYEVACEIDR